MPNEAQTGGRFDEILSEYGMLGAPSPEPPRELPGVPDPQGEVDPIDDVAPPATGGRFDEILAGYGMSTGGAESPKPLVPKEVRDNARRADISDEDALQHIPDQLPYEPSAELLEDVDWQRDPEAFEISHRKMVSELNRARSKPDKARILMEWSREWNPSIAAAAEEEAGVFMRAGVGALTGLANVVMWVDSWSGRPIRAMGKSLWASRERHLRGGDPFSMEEMTDSISRKYDESDASFEDGEDTLKAMAKYVAAVAGSPFGWVHQEATGGAYTDAMYADSISENVDKMFDWGADVIQSGAWTAAGVAAELWPGGEDYADWKEKRKKSVEAGSSFGHGTLGFVGLVLSDPITFLSLPGAIKQFRIGLTDSGNNVIKDAIAMSSAKAEREMYTAAAASKADGAASPFLDDAGEIVTGKIRAEAQGMGTFDVQTSVMDVADTSFRNGVVAHGWGSVETLKIFRSAIEKSDPSYWKSVVPDMTDEAAEAAAGEFVLDKQVMSLVEGILEKSGSKLGKEATPTMKLEAAWSSLARESSERKELFHVSFKMTGEVDPNTGKEVVEHFVDWIDPRKVLNERGQMFLGLEPGAPAWRKAPTKVEEVGLAVEKGMVGAAGAAGRALRKKGPVTAEQAAKLDDAAKAAAFDKTRIVHKSDNRRVRWGMAIIDKIPALERARMNIGSIAFLQKAQPYVSRLGSNFHKLKPMHGAMWRKWERLELRDQAVRTLNRQQIANHIERINGIVTATGERGKHVRYLAMTYQELGTHIPVTEGQLETLAWLSKMLKGLDDIESGAWAESGLRAFDNLSVRTVRLLSEAAEAGGVSDLTASIAKDLEKIHAAVGQERKALLTSFKANLNLTSDILRKVLSDDYRVKAEMDTLGALVPYVEKLKTLRVLHAELEDTLKNKDLSEASSLDRLNEQLRVIKELQDEGVDAARGDVPPLAKNEAELLQHLRTTGFIPEGSFIDWSTHKDWLHDRVRNAVRATGVDDWEQQGEAVMATMKARADSWALWNKLPEGYADAWFTKYSKEIEEEVVGRAVEAIPMESAARRIADTLDGVEGKRILSEMQASAVTPEMGTAYAKLAASRANAWAIANDRPAEEFLARLNIRTAEDIDEVFGKTIYEIDPDFKPTEIVGGTGKLSDPAEKGGLPWQWQMATPRELDDFMDLLGGKYREDYVKKVAGATESEAYERRFAAWQAMQESDEALSAAWDAYHKQSKAFDESVAYGVPWAPRHVREAAKSGSKLLDMSGAHAYNQTVDRWEDMLRFYVRTESDGTVRLALAPRRYANLDADELIAGSEEWIAKAELHTFKDPVGKTIAWRKEEERAIALYKEKQRLYEAWNKEYQRVYDSIWHPDKLKTTNGFIIFGEQEKVAIFLLESARPGTLGHELGHFFRRDLPQELQDRAATWAEGASGIGKVGDKWSIGMEEAFAEAFELYLKTGVAPKGSGMAGVFRKFKEWIKQIMSPLIASGKLKKLDPEIRSIFDEMFDAGSIKGGTGSAAARAADDGRQIISSFQSSTFQEMIKGVGRIFAKDLPKKDYDIASDWIQRELGEAGFKKNGEWSKAGQSMWAQGFANWTKSGKVTNHGLREVFAKFKDWIFRVYRAVSGNKEYKFKVSPEVEDVFDRLLSKQAGYKTHPLSREFDVVYRTYMTSMGGSDSILSKAMLNEVLIALMEAAKYAPHQIRQTERMLFSKSKADSIKAYNFIKNEVADKLAGRFDPPRDSFQIKAPKFKNNRESFQRALVGSLQEYAGLAGDEARLLVDDFYDVVKGDVISGGFSYKKGSEYYQEMVVALAKKYVQRHPEKAPGYPRMGYEVPNRTVADILVNHERASIRWRERGPRFEARMPAEGETFRAGQQPGIKTGGVEFPQDARLDYYKATKQLLEAAGTRNADELARRILAQQGSVKHSEMLELDEAIEAAVENLGTPEVLRRVRVESEAITVNSKIGPLDEQLRAAKQKQADIMSGKAAVEEALEVDDWLATEFEAGPRASARHATQKESGEALERAILEDDFVELERFLRAEGADKYWLSMRNRALHLLEAKPRSRGARYLKGRANLLASKRDLAPENLGKLTEEVAANRRKGALRRREQATEDLQLLRREVGEAAVEEAVEQPTLKHPTPVTQAEWNKLPKEERFAKVSSVYVEAEGGLFKLTRKQLEQVADGDEWINVGKPLVKTARVGDKWKNLPAALYADDAGRLSSGKSGVEVVGMDDIDIDYAKATLEQHLYRSYPHDAPKPAAAAEAVPLQKDLVEQIHWYNATTKLPDHKDIGRELAGLQGEKFRSKIETILSDVLKREHGVDPLVAGRLAKQEFGKGQINRQQIKGLIEETTAVPVGIGDEVIDVSDSYVRDMARRLAKDLSPGDLRFDKALVESALGGKSKRALSAAAEAKGEVARLEAELAELTARKADLAEELKSLNVTESDSYLAEAGEVSARRESIHQTKVETTREETKWVKEEISRLEARIGGARAEARLGADKMAKAAFEKELAPMATYVEGETGRRRRVLGGGEDEITGVIERVERRIAEGLTRGQPGRMKDAADLPSVVPKKLTEAMKKKIEALPGAKKEMLDIARKLNWDLTDTGEIWEMIVNYRKQARAYGDVEEAKRYLALKAMFDEESLLAFNRMPETDKTVVINILKDPRKYSLPPGATPKMKKMAADLGMSPSGKEDIFVHLSGKGIQKRYGVPIKKVRAGDHFEAHEIEEAMQAASVIKEFLKEKLDKLQAHGRLTKYRDKEVGAKIDAINRKLRGKADMVGDETAESLKKDLLDLKKHEYRDWTEQDFLRRVGVAGYMPHMMRHAARRKIDGMRGKLLPANYKTGFESMRTRASILDDINELARNELAEDMLYHDVTSIHSGGPGFESVFTGKSKEELEAIYDAATSGKLREHFSDEEWSSLLKAKRQKGELDGVYEFFETDYNILIKRYAESVDKAIADQVFIKDIMDLFPIGKEMGQNSYFIENPDMAREFGYARLNKRDHIEAVGRMKLPKELTPDIENWVNQQLADGVDIPQVMAGLRRQGVSVPRNVVELYRAMPDVFVPEPVLEYLRWMRAPSEVNPGWNALLSVSDGFHALAKTMATVSSVAHVGMNFGGNYVSVAQKIGSDLFNPRHHYNSWILMASDTWPAKFDHLLLNVGGTKMTVKEVKQAFAREGIDESPRTLAFLEEQLGTGDVATGAAPLGHMLLGTGIGATGGWIAGSAMAGPLGGAAGGFLGSWAGALGGEILGKSWRTAIDPATGKAVAGVFGKELDLAKGVGTVSDTEVGKFVNAIEEAQKGKLKEGVQYFGERMAGVGAATVVGSAIGGPATAVASAIGGLSFPSYIRMMSSLNQSVEIQARRLLGLAEMSRGKSMNEVAFSVQDTLRNYSHLTPVERNVLRRLFFFYTWDAGNVRFQLNQLVNYPRQAAIFNQFMAGMYNGQFTESEIQALPEYLRWKAIMRLGGAKIYSFSGLPQQAAIELSRGFGTHGGKPIGLFSRGRPDMMLLAEWMLGGESLYYSKGWNELNNVRQMKNAPPALKWIVGYPSKPVDVPVYKKGRIVGRRKDYRSNNPERMYIMSRLPGWRVMQEYMKLATDTFISRALDYGDPSAQATTEEKMLAYSIGVKPYFVDFESQREYMAHRLMEALQTEWDRVNKNFVSRHNYLNKNWNYTRGQLLYPGDVVDEDMGE